MEEPTGKERVSVGEKPVASERAKCREQPF